MLHLVRLIERRFGTAAVRALVLLSAAMLLCGLALAWSGTQA